MKLIKFMMQLQNELDYTRANTLQEKDSKDRYDWTKSN